MSLYRRVHIRIYGDSKFKQLDGPQPNAQSLFMYLLTSEFTGMIPGVLKVGEAALAEALRWPIEGFRAAFAKIEERGMAVADWDARLIFLPNALKHNEPANGNFVKSWRSAFQDLPECPLRNEVYRKIVDFLTTHKGGQFLHNFIGDENINGSGSASSSEHGGPMEPVSEPSGESFVNGSGRVAETISEPCRNGPLNGLGTGLPTGSAIGLSTGLATGMPISISNSNSNRRGRGECRGEEPEQPLADARYVAGETPTSETSALFEGIKPKTAQRGDKPPDAYERFLRDEMAATYPRPVQFKSALALLRKLKPNREQLDEILEWIEAWRSHWEADGTKAIPGMHSFLNDPQYQRHPPADARTRNGGMTHSRRAEDLYRGSH